MKLSNKGKGSYSKVLGLTRIKQLGVCHYIFLLMMAELFFGLIMMKPLFCGESALHNIKKVLP